MEDSIFIKVLEYGEKVGLEGTSYKDFLKWAMEEGFINPKSHKAQDVLQGYSLRKIFSECFGPSSYIDKEKINHTSNVLKTEYYFRLIEHRELQESRTAAKLANKNAMFAIGISIAAIIVSAVLTFTQLNTPDKMSKSDLQALINSNAVQREIKLDKLQMAQILSAIESSQSKADIQKPKAILPSNEAQHHELINRYFEEQ